MEISSRIVKFCKLRTGVSIAALSLILLGSGFTLWACPEGVLLSARPDPQSDNLYKRIAAPAGASPEQLRKAFTYAAALFHEDKLRLGGATDAEIEASRVALTRIMDAWRILKDPVAREKYDKSLGFSRADALLAVVEDRTAEESQRRGAIDNLLEPEFMVIADVVATLKKVLRNDSELAPSREMRMILVRSLLDPVLYDALKVPVLRIASEPEKEDAAIHKDVLSAVVSHSSLTPRFLFGMAGGETTKNVVFRRNAVDALAFFSKDARVLSSLQAILNDVAEPIPVRLAALDGLAPQIDQPNIRALFKSLAASDPSPQIRSDARSVIEGEDTR